MPSTTSLIPTGLIWLIFVLGCSFEPVDQQMVITETVPADGETTPANKALRVRFDRYLDPGTVVSSAIALKSGDASASFRVSYDPVDQAIVVLPRLNMRVGIQYSLTIKPNVVAGLDGTTIESEHSISFRVTLAEEQLDLTTKLNFETDLRPIIEHRCNCHGPEPAVFPELAPSALVDRQSQRQSDRTLVISGRPLESYLVQRILRDYPGVRGDEKTLTNDERRLFVRWVTELSAGTQN